MSSEYTREQLIDICEKAIVDEQNWWDRDSSSAQQGVGTAWAFLRGNVPFTVLRKGDLQTDSKTIWLRFHVKGFRYFDSGAGREEELVYLPGPGRISADGGDWY